MCKRLLLLALSISALLVLNGCWSNKQINDLAFVMGVAIDQGEEDGEYAVTAQIARPSALGLQSRGGDEEAYANITDTSIGIERAIAKISGQINRQIYTSHNQAVIISMDVAKRDITPVLDYFVRSSAIRFTETVYIAQGDARDFLDIKGDLEVLPITYLKQLGESRLWSGEMSRNSLASLLNGLLSKTSKPMISILKMVKDEDGEKRAVLSGMAVFKDAQICTVLDEEQTEAVMLVQKKTKGSDWQIDIFGGYMTLEVMESTVDMLPVFSGDTLEKIVVDIDLGCSINDMSGEADVLALDTRAEIANALETKISDNLTRTFEYTQTYGADVFGFGELLYRVHTKRTKELVDNWDTEYSNLDVEFRVSVEILSTGSIIQPLDTGNMKGNN